MLLHDLLYRSAEKCPDHDALASRGERMSYAALADDVASMAGGLFNLDLEQRDRIAVFLDKQFETVIAILGTAAAGLTFVPINPALRAAQAAYIMKDCNVRVLITTKARFSALQEVLDDCPDLRWIFIVNDAVSRTRRNGQIVEGYDALVARGRRTIAGAHPTRDTDMAGILYTSGSTGNPKGVVFSHRNFVAGAQSVSSYLHYRPSDRVINIPPYSFDFGLNQLFSSLCVGATAVLHNFMTTPDLLDAIAAEGVTGVSGVPTVMIQLAAQEWPTKLVEQIRYMSTTGGRMPEPAVRALRKALPRTDLYLMYGLTEAFRATYLPPSEVDRRPGSIGKAIPGAEVLVVRPDGTICDPGEPGELVQKGVLVTMGYWNDPVRTAERFRPAPGVPADARDPELAVYSGDTVKTDADGFIYFIGRKDEMIKTRGYRVSPTEVEEAIFATGLASAAAAVGVEDAVLGQVIVVFVTPKLGRRLDAAAILERCRKALPAYMVPHRVVEREAMPLNANGKVDRKRLGAEYAEQLAVEPDLVKVADAPARAKPSSFFGRWRRELEEALGLRRRRFESVIEVFRWAFPDRAVSPDDSFVSLAGDSLSYVSVSLGLDELLPELPRDWADRSIASLTALRGRSASSTSILRPEIIARVVAMLSVVASHAVAHWEAFSGGAKLMMLISGLSFARFTWNEDPHRTLSSTARFAAHILVPTLVFLTLAFIALGHIDWPILLFVDNLVSQGVPPWWLGSWYIQNLLQFLAVMVTLAFVPGVARFASRRKYLFGVGLTAAAMAIYIGCRTLEPEKLKSFVALPQDFFWLFAFGWLVAASEAPAQKLGAFALLAASIAVVATASTFMFSDQFGLWLLLGVAFLFSGWTFSAPRWINVAIVTVARSMLFVYLLYWPLSLLVPLGLRTRVAVGFCASLVIWALWESLSRTILSYWPVSRPASRSASPSHPGRVVADSARDALGP
jgi:acyl-CoA ligase (AMP-forming) (exosortase A-associated)